ncbi:hypothetical protein GQ37_013825 [Janthinobacterium sp. BJB1]|uniref:hypothetical protein n=1 Tax=Janthinobacterium sp. GW458P TaxID=1981504 RepID=UPI000A3293B1|nr:hypothetical protein [Janthinobacterium sp. GW458P]MBE3024410.1 hypothetical protein [Janthinobacterium sp. GW458P]PHV15184.1 hypothetical protein CSQ90_19365 [Janthinobacterium sp. BJB303]PJC98137.1 hypothetical protein GQ37_013825 [Janthinobacterium sp. BJB1]
MNVTHWRAQELKHHSAQIVWLDAVAARRAYDLLGLYDSKTHSGLNGNSVGSVERFECAEDAATATQWLRARVPGAQQLVVVFGEDECFSCSSVFFIENWPDIFVPLRDDAMVYSNDTPLILFYCHENIFELGQRIVFD